MERVTSGAPETDVAPSPEYLAREPIAATYESMPREIQNLADAVFDAARDVIRERFRTFGDDDEDRNL